MLLADVVRTSRQVSATSLRNAKVLLIADLLRQCVLLVARSLDDITDRVPEVVGLIRSPPPARAIFDGELIALHPDGRPKPFQENGSRAASRVDPEVARARTPLTAYLFDVLHRDGVDLIDEPSRGRRSGWLSNIHLGARDPRRRFGPQDGFVLPGKTFKGLTDEMLRWQSAELPRHAVGPIDGYVVELRPEVVVEIAFDGVQTSPRYPGGLALPFARVVRHRPDKTASEADTIELVEALHQL